MNKNKAINELTNILAIALRHKIGSLVNENEIYAQKYSRDADILIKQARIISQKENWNSYNKEKIRGQLKIKLRKELEEKDFLNSKKFEIMDEELEKVLEDMDL